MSNLRTLVVLRRNIQAIYFMIFVLVLLVPNFFILDMVNKPIYTIVPFLLIPTSFYMFYLSMAKKPGLMIYLSLPFIFMGAFQLVLITLSRSAVIGADMYTNIYTTNSSEAGDVLKTLVPVLTGIILLYGGTFTLGWFSFKNRYDLPNHTRKNIKIISVALFMIGLMVSIIPYNLHPRYAISKDVFPINVSTNFGISINRWIKSKKYPETSKDFTFNASKPISDNREIYILVVGESSRADKWSIYGYNRETSPLLTKKIDDLAIMTDAVTQSNTTHKSTALLMSAADATNFEDIYIQKSMVAAFREAGFKTLFISNQGANGSFMDFYASQADERVDIPKRKYENGECVDYDHKALPYLRDFIDKNDGNIFIVVHTYGSHLQYVDRYTDEFARFTPASSDDADPKAAKEINNAYDNTILYTDHFLSQIIDIVDSVGVCSAVTYISDHGEDLFDDNRNRFLHSSPTLTYYQLHIPYFIWFSDRYKDVYTDKFSAAFVNRNKSTSSSSLFHTVTDMAGVETSYKNVNNSIVSKDYKETERMFLDDAYEPVEFYNTGLDSMDFQLMRRKGIKYDPAKVLKTF